MIKRKGLRINKNGQLLKKNALTTEQICLTNSLRTSINISVENLYVDVGAVNLVWQYSLFNREL